MTPEKKVEDPERGTDTTPAVPRLWCTHCDGEVLLRLSKHGPGHETPMTIPELFQESVERFGAYPALASKNGKKCETLTFSQYYELCQKAARSLIKLGLQRFHGVGILGFNSVEWVTAALGTILAGGLCVGIYVTNSAEACQYVIKQANVDVLIVENDQQLQKILSIPPDKMETVKAIVQFRLPLMENNTNLYSAHQCTGRSQKLARVGQGISESSPSPWTLCQPPLATCLGWHDFMELGNAIPNMQLDRIILSQKANQCAIIIYTSGTTGTPKGVMLSHDNITWMAGAMAREIEISRISGKQDVIVSYLPLSHIAAQITDIWVPIKMGALTFFAQPDALRGTLVYTLQEVKPTIFMGVPRIWEKMQDTIKENVAKSSNLRKKAFAWAKMLGLKVNTKRMLGKRDIPMNYRMAKALVFSKVRSSLGLDNCHAFFSGASPLSQDVSEFFLSLDIPIGEIYGMSECSGPHSVSNKNVYRVLSCGKVLNGCKNMLYKQNKDGVGEVCMWGRHVFMGYLNKEDATLEALDEDGWLHSGDIGRLDSHDFLYITGRIKEILITAGGENVYPIPIETLVKEKIPIISHAMLVGDKANFLSMLLTLKCETDQMSGEPLDRLSKEAISFCQSLGSQAATVSDILKIRDPMVYTAIQYGIDIVNQQAISDSHSIRKWIILEKDFSIQGGELGPTSKLKRAMITQKYKAQIDSMYSS
ncbi:long-chain-fatty-acid--CoA ligase ACSBG2 isoform X2 [Mastomys coucha]|uniref:long-chain-fatty-acid--CoA ligase ACSBG2 isoform X2 n=1 Tax=Mastomys coucha TaxID=35658 RepID=UPI001261B5CD|nr:long-chain-fatty-acid--CoA ligase ACSBG2 isoform X2 [Mastomys coucha]